MHELLTRLSPSIQDLVKALCALPGVRTKTAQRMAMHILEQDRSGGRRLAQALKVVLDKVGDCERCRNFSEAPSCPICADLTRDASLLCIVESTLDLLALEQLNEYRGYYFVLRGRLSPIDGIGPEELGLDLLAQQLQRHNYQEVIIATNPTAEGEATAIYLNQLIKKYGSQTKVTRIAYGVPVGGELEYLDSNTLGQALAGRVVFN